MAKPTPIQRRMKLFTLSSCANPLLFRSEAPSKHKKGKKKEKASAGQQRVSTFEVHHNYDAKDSGGDVYFKVSRVIFSL